MKKLNAQFGPIHRFTYELAANKGDEIDDNSVNDLRAESTNPPFTMQFDEIASSLESPTNFTVGIRLKTDKGYRSTIRSITTIEIHPIIISTITPEIQPTFYDKLEDTSTYLNIAIIGVILLFLLIGYLIFKYITSITLKF